MGENNHNSYNHKSKKMLMNVINNLSRCFLAFKLYDRIYVFPFTTARLERYPSLTMFLIWVNIRPRSFFFMFPQLLSTYCLQSWPNVGRSSSAGIWKPNQAGEGQRNVANQWTDWGETSSCQWKGSGLIESLLLHLKV